MNFKERWRSQEVEDSLPLADFIVGFFVSLGIGLGLGSFLVGFLFLVAWVVAVHQGFVRGRPGYQKMIYWIMALWLIFMLMKPAESLPPPFYFLFFYAVGTGAGLLFGFWFLIWKCGRERVNAWVVKNRNRRLR